MKEESLPCPECGAEMAPVIKMPNELAGLFAVAGFRSKHVEGQQDGFLCPECGKFIQKEGR